MGMALVMQDRRESKRLSLRVPVDINGGSPGMTRDISATGMLFHSEQAFAVGDQITVAFRIGHKAEQQAATVVRSDDLETAVRFDRPSSLAAN